MANRFRFFTTETPGTGFSLCDRELLRDGLTFFHLQIRRTRTVFNGIQQTNLDLDQNGTPIEIRSPGMLPIYRDGNIAFAWHKIGAKNGATQQRAVRFMQFSLHGSPGGPPAATLNVYETFGSSSVTTECPDLTMTGNGNIVIVYGRRGWSAPLNPEARYIVYYLDGRGLQAAQTLRKGEYSPSQTQYCDSSVGISDYLIAAADPAAANVAWVIANYADKKSNKIQTVAGRVTLQ